jgi:hypothetical protein
MGRLIVCLLVGGLCNSRVLVLICKYKNTFGVQQIEGMHVSTALNRNIDEYISYLLCNKGLVSERKLHYCKYRLDKLRLCKKKPSVSDVKVNITVNDGGSRAASSSVQSRCIKGLGAMRLPVEMFWKKMARNLKSVFDKKNVGI